MLLLFDLKIAQIIVPTLSSNYFFKNLSGLRCNFIFVMNYTSTSNYPSRSIYINPMNYLKLHLNLLLSIISAIQEK